MAKTDWFHLYNVLLEHSDEKNKLSLDRIQKLFDVEYGIQLTRQSDNIYRLDHAVTATQKKILNAYGLTAKTLNTGQTGSVKN